MEKMQFCSWVLHNFYIGFANLCLLCVFILSLNSVVNGKRPDVVNIGAILTYDSIIGRVAKVAIEGAIEDVNLDKNVLAGTKLNLIMKNDDCNAFIGAIEVLKVLEEDAVAIVGPQSSTIANMISFISSGLQVPLITFAATDPTLSSLQYPFFLRVAQSDSYQMEAMADLISYYGWRKVIGIYVDNEYGRNGMYALDDELAKKMSSLHKISIPLKASRKYMMDVMRASKDLGPRVYVVHASPDSGLEIFIVARELNMMTNDYVWLATDWLCSTLDTLENLDLQKTLSGLQGVVGFRQYVPESSQRNNYLFKWEKMQNKSVTDSRLNAYGYYAYDTIWAIAYAIDRFFNDNGNLTFSLNDDLMNLQGNLQFDKLRTFDNGHILLQKLLLSNFTGLTGQVQFDRSQNLISGMYQVINIDGHMIRTVGYWANHMGLSTLIPDILHTNGSKNYKQNQSLDRVFWPGGEVNIPRGWVPSTNEKPLRIAVPHRLSYGNIVNVSEDNHSFQGYAIDVFRAAIKLVPYEIPYRFVPFGDGIHNPSYWGLINMVADREVDAAIGDITILKNRTKIVDFTQPFTSTGLVIVVPIKSIKSNIWVFLRPFSVGMWGVTGAFFLLVGVVVWLLEHRVNSDFRGSPKRQCFTIFLFSFSSLFHSEQENTLSALGRFVMVVWFFLLLVITSSYTASLTSFLTVQQLPPSINGIDSLIASNEPIGYQEGSFARIYMVDALKIRPQRLIPLTPPDDYVQALQKGPKNGGVAAIVDEFPYIELFLKNTQGFGKVGQPFTRSGWGFAFPRGSPLPIDLSSAILKLSENGDLQKIYKNSFCGTDCRAQSAERSRPEQLHLSNFLGLFILCGIAIAVSLLLFLLKSIRQFIRYKSKQQCPTEISNRGCSQMIYSFFEFLDEKEEAIVNMFKQKQNNEGVQNECSH